MTSSNDLYYYLKRVQREAGISISASFPSTPSNEEQYVIDCINTTLRELNNHYYLTFRQVEYTLTTSANVSQYDLRQSPYSQTYWRVNRIAKQGVRRVRDDYPLQFLDYAEVDWLQPSLTAGQLPTCYSQYGEYLTLYPKADGSQLKIRYYPAYIGTDVTGVTQKLTLSVTSDLPILDDMYEDALVYGAAVKVRRWVKVDEKYMELKKVWEEWRRNLIDMMQPGEDGFPTLQLATSSASYIQRKIGPFFNTNLGG